MHDDGVETVMMLRLLLAARLETFCTKAVHAQRGRDIVVDLGHVVLVAGRREPFQLQHHDAGKDFILNRTLRLIQS